MGRIGSGVEVRPKSIRLNFSWEGQPQRHTLSVNGEPLLPTPANLRYAHRLAAEIRDRIRLGTFSLAEYFPGSSLKSGPITLAMQLDTWIAAQRIEHSTRAGYTSALKFWKLAPCNPRRDPLGEVPVRSLRLSQILAALASRPALSGKTVNNYVSVLREAVQLAVDDRMLIENPVLKVPRAKHQKTPPDPFSRDELELIIEQVQARHPGQVAHFIEFWFWTGLRTSEIFGLRWEHIDLVGHTLLVKEAVVRGLQKASTKTQVARTVMLNSRAQAALQAQRSFTQVQGGPVFLDPRYDTPWLDERAFRRSFWTPTLKTRGIRYRRPYNMRHTYATQMLMAGMTPAFCARQMGHSIEMFLNTYAKWLDGAQNDLEMARLEATLSSPNLPRKTKKRT